MPRRNPSSHRSRAASQRLKPQDVTTAVLRTADTLRRRVSAVLAPHAVSSQQYNVLRILRGVHPGSLPTLEVGARMIEQTPGITRLLDRLEAAGLAQRERSGEDRRLVECRITTKGLSLLAELDAPIDEMNRHAVRALDAEEREAMMRLLAHMRDER